MPPPVSPRATARGHGATPLAWYDEAEHRRILAESINELREGKINAVGSITFTANAATTTLTDRRVGPNSRVLLMPTTENAATAMNTWWITGRGDGTAVVNHANNAQTDRSFDFVVLG